MDYKDYIIKRSGAEHFWYRAKRELIDKLLASIYGDYQSERLFLEIGCGTGSQLPVMKKYGQVEGIEIDEAAATIARQQGFSIKTQNIEEESLGENKFSGIGLFDVLEHVQNDTQLLQKIFLSLKEEGYLFLMVPAFHFLFGPHDRALGHFRRYQLNNLLVSLRQAGFLIIRRGYWNTFLFPAIVVVRLIKKFFTAINKSAISEYSDLPEVINYLLYKSLNFENYLITCRQRNLPFGLSLIIIAQKPTKSAPVTN